VSGGAPAVAPAAARKVRFQSRAVQVAGALALLVLGLVTLLLIGVDVGPVGLATGLALAILPAPLYVYLALIVDRFEPEPVALLAWSFFWGASVATTIAYVANTAGQAVGGAEFGTDVGEIYGGSVSAPIVEEGAKAAVLFGIYRWRRHRIDGVLDGMVYAAMVGLGFATMENVLYYGNAAVEGGVPLVATFFVRGVMSPFTHPLFTCMTGIGLGLAVRGSSRALRVGAPAGGLAAAIALHSLWNTSATVGDGAAFLGVYSLLMVPLFVGLVAVALVAMGREGRVVVEELAPELARGLVAPADLELLSSARDRRRWLRAARRDGARHRRAAAAFQAAATELAFQRRRARRGDAEAAASLLERERAFAVALGELVANLGPAAQQVRGQAQRRLSWQPPAPAPAPPPGWHPDPWRQARWRWWDGRAWTSHVA
jgi:RsiW-degrading membrane proteinase PrsW (M82 family)